MDAGDPVARHDNDPAIWLRALPSYAELQLGEIANATDHIEGGVPDRRLATLPRAYRELLRHRLPIEPAEAARLRRFEAGFAQLCSDLTAAHGVASIQHDDLHRHSLFVDGPSLRILDWGDASVAHPFATLVVTFQWLEQTNGLAPDDPWFERLRDAYLEPWGRGLADVFDLSLRVGLVAQAFGWLRHREAMPEPDRGAFDILFADLLRRIIAKVVEPGF